MGNVNSGSVAKTQEGAINITIVSSSFMDSLDVLEFCDVDLSNKDFSEDRARQMIFVDMILKSHELLNLTSDRAVLIKPHVVQGGIL
jgi:hypothetical protein